MINITQSQFRKKSPNKDRDVIVVDSVINKRYTYEKTGLAVGISITRVRQIVKKWFFDNYGVWGNYPLEVAIEYAFKGRSSES
jgi:hypothetical protein